MTPPPGQRRSWWAPALCAGIVALLAAPALNRWFDNPDDWDHLDAAHAVLTGQPGAFAGLFFSDLAHASLRPLPTLVWVWDRAAWDWTAAGFFGTNVGLLALLGAAVTLLVVRLHPGAPLLAVAAGALATLSPATAQATWYLSARDDLLANLFFVAAVVTWLGPGSRWRTALLAGLGALCKPTLLALPLVIGLLDRVHGVPLRQSARRLLPTLGVLSGYAVVLATVLAGDGGGGSVPSGLRADLGILRTVSAFLAPGFARHGGLGALAPDLLRLGLLAWVAVAGWRRADQTLLRVGGAWIGATLLLPLPWLLADGFSIQDSGRYLQLPGIGFALVVAGLLSPLTQRSRLAAALTPACALSFALADLPDWPRGHTPSRALFEALERAPEAPTLVGVSRLDGGAASLTGSDVLAARRGGERPRIFVQGGALVHVASRQAGERFAYGSFEIVDTQLDLAGLDPQTRLLVELEHEGTPAFVEVIRTEGSFQAPGTAGATLELLQDRTTQADAHIAPGAVWRTLRRARRAPAHVGQTTDLDPRAWCRAQVDLELHDPAPRRGPGAMAFAVPTGRFALLQFSEEADPTSPFAHVLLVPLPDGTGRHTATLDLRTAPEWVGLPRIQWLGVTPVNHRGRARVRAVRLSGC